MAYAPIPRPESTVDACEASLRRSILSGELSPGTRLPPERELAKRFGVNRVTVRSALGRLAASHLVSVRQGSGYVVRDYRRDGGPDLLAGLGELARSGDDLPALASDLLLVRRHLASAVLERLGAAHDEDDAAASLARVRARIERFAELVDEGADAEALAEADLEIVGAIVDATNSAVLRLCLNPVVTVLRELPELRDALYVEPRANLAAYRLLLERLASPGPELAEAMTAEMAARDEQTIARLAEGSRA